MQNISTVEFNVTQTMGIVGGGAMGVSLAALFLSKGYNVILKTRRKEAASIIAEKITTLARKVSSNYPGKLTIVMNYSELSPAQLIIEAVEEKIETKKGVLMEAEASCPNAFYASNTSSLSITQLAQALNDKTKLVGMHFFNPAHKMQLVEIVKTPYTSVECINQIENTAASLGKTAVIVNDSPGFVVNRLLMPFLLDAVKLRDAGVASEKDIDAAVKLGLNHPMGPFELLDLIGIDVFVSILEQLKLELPTSIARMVQEGKLGRKTKQGFYSY